MPRGRPKGSKNKVKVAATTSMPVEKEVKIIGLEAPKKRERKEPVETNPDWLITTTANGTPIAIEAICKFGGDCEFVVIPNYKDKTSKITVKSEDVVRPIMTPEQEKELEGVKFWTAPVKEESVNEGVQTSGVSAEAITV